MHMAVRERRVLLILLVAILVTGCKVIPPEDVGPHVPPDWSSLNQTSTPPPVQAAAAKVVQVASFPYAKFPNMPLYLKDFVRPDTCNWMGIAGQIFDQNGNPVTGVVVKVGGQLGARSINNMSTTGNVAEYGPGGYEIDLAAAPEASTASLWVTLYDSQGKQLSARNFFDTYNDCSKNLVLFNFRQNIENQYYFPVVFR